jgi:apolipoprotein N-acyltransferase
MSNPTITPSNLDNIAIRQLEGDVPMNSRSLAGPTVAVTSHWFWLWLVVGAALLPLTGWQAVIPLAAWLAPIFIVRFARTQRISVAILIVPITSCLATIVAWRNDFFGPPSPVTYIFIIVGVLFSLGYVVDRLVAPRLSACCGRWCSLAPSQRSSFS